MMRPPPPLPLLRLRELPPPLHLPLDAAAPAAAGPHRPEQGAGPADDDVAGKRDDADKHRGDHQELHVTIFDMSKFVRQHRLKFRVVERVHQPARYRDGIVTLAHATGEGVARVGFDDAQHRHRDAAADAESLKNVPEPRFGLAVDGSRAGDRVDDPLVSEPRDDEPDNRAGESHRHEPRQEIERIPDAVSHRRIVQRRDHERETEADQQEQKWKTGKQHQRLQPVVPDIRLEPIGAEQGRSSGWAYDPPLEFHLRRGLRCRCFRRVELVELAIAEAKRAGKKHRREGLRGCVVFLDRVVEEAAGSRDLVFEVGQLALQLQEILVRLEFGIGLGEGEELPECTGQHVLGLRLRLRIGGGGGGVPCLHHGVQCAAFVCGIALHRLDQVRYQVAPLLELDRNVRPRLADGLPQADQPVVGNDEKKPDHNDRGDNDPADCTHDVLPLVRSCAGGNLSRPATPPHRPGANAIGGGGRLGSALGRNGFLRRRV